MATEIDLIETTVIDVSDRAVSGRQKGAVAPLTARPLEGKVAIVTGGSTGIGRATALALGEAGARVAVLGRDVAGLRETVAAAGDAGRLLYLSCDLGSVAEMESVGEFVDRMDRPVDLLVHAAGVQVDRGVADGDVADLDEQYLVNLRAPYVLTQLVMPHLLSGPGHVVFINSDDGRSARGGNAQHAMTNHGLTALADSLRHEVEPSGVRVTSIFVGGPGIASDGESSQAGTSGGSSPLLQSSDVAAAVVSVATLPERVEITDLMVRPVGAGNRS